LDAEQALHADRLPLFAEVIQGGSANNPRSQDSAAAKSRLKWRLAVGAACAGTALLLVRPGTGGAGESQPSKPEVGVTTLSEVATCVGQGENCLSSQCCRDGGAYGLVCYEKNQYWASCEESCKPGVHAGEKFGHYDQDGKFEADPWSCQELGNRSQASCTAFGKASHCPKGRCMWKDDSCLPACDTFGDEPGCSSSDKCMWKGTCMEACHTFGSEKSCHPDSKCVWKNEKCQAGCWTFGGDICGKNDRCTWAGSECKDACWTFFSEDQCGKHSQCMFDQGKCKPACHSFGDKAVCPHEFGCAWTQPEGQPSGCRLDPCAAHGEDCSRSGCCSAERGAGGQRCFKKDKHYATCMNVCDKKSNQTKDWSCKALGNRTLLPTGCAWAGEDCSKDQLCCNIGFSCLKRDDSYTGCVQTVEKTTWFAKQMPLPAGWRGDYVGPGRTEYQVSAAGQDEAVAGTSLYCFMAVLPNSQEVTLMNLAKRNKASIFACDASDVFNSWQSSSSAWDTGEATLTNTDVFINVWEQMHKAGQFANFDWTVKVDADAVIVPWRLKAHIAALRPPANRAIYLKNNHMDAGLGNGGFLGAVEVFSRDASQLYFDNAPDCRRTLGVHAGEDGFFKGCMDAIGVGFMVDANMFKPDVSPGVCNTESRAAFHPLKDPVNWQCCVDLINGQPHNVVYGKCELGYSLDLQFK